MRWSELELERCTWRIPVERSKGGHEHLVPLNGLAVDILRACPCVEGCDAAFATRGKREAFGGWSSQMSGDTTN
jgi:hypothetical protein